MIRLILIISFVVFVLFSSSIYSGDDRFNIEPSVINSNIASHSEVSRIIKLTQVDNMFLPAEITVLKGETIKFVIKNLGNRKHEMLVGSMAKLKKYAKKRRMFPEMNQSEPDLIQLEPGEQKELILQFTNAGTVHFACPLPGHFKKMRGKIFVEKK
ncbi:MAG: cupredoxin domain-containing protein [Betaproteobacteria bacterium]|nr:cupredoxin domain-containing protein [Betaproteobacteria bacterium]